VKPVYLTLALLVAAPSLAWAAPADFAAAHDGGDWAGCVFQEGFDPYEITLTRAKNGFIVTYPSLCYGTHRRAIGNTTDAAEIIHTDETSICVPMMMVDYSLRGEDLHLTFHGAISATARLRLLTPQSAPAACQTQGLTS